MKSSRTFFNSAVAAMALSLSSVALAQDIAALSAKADQAFAAGDYGVAVEVYTKIKDSVDPQRKSMIEERLRFANRQLASMKSKGIPTATQPAAADHMAPSADAGPRKPHQKPADGQLLELSLLELGNFEFNEALDAPLPSDVQALSGSRVKLSGQMLSLDQTGKINRFILVNDLLSCCFGGTPKLQQIVYVQLPKDKWMEQTAARISIEGKLTVRVRKEDGYVVSLFEVEPSSIKLAAQ
ncbi:MAG TPA: DUF3299 domain-containing protein [Tepidisphaeraceae bacterium]|jgi:hypothetical protein